MRKPFWILAAAFTIAFGLAVAGIATATTHVVAADETDTADTEAHKTDPNTGDDGKSTDPMWEHITGRLLSPSRHRAHALAFADEDGVLVAGVEEGSALDKAGVARGDIVLSVDGAPVKGMLELEKALAQADGRAELEIKHGDDTRTLTIAIGEDGTGLIGLGGAPCGGAAMMHMAVPALAALPASAIVAAIEEDGPAAKAGIEEGEHITALDGQKVEGASELVDMLSEHKPGDRVSVTVSSGEDDDADERDVPVTLGEHPDDDERAFLGVMLASAAHDMMNGMPFGGMPAFGGPDTTSGPIVGQVTEGSPANEAGLEAGAVILSVDGVDVATPEEVVGAIAKHQPGDSVTLAVKAAGEDEARDVRVVLGSHPDDEEKAYLGVNLGMMFRHELPEGLEGVFEGFGAPGAEMFGIPFGETDGDTDGTGGTFRFRIPGPNTDTAPAGSGSA